MKKARKHIFKNEHLLAEMLGLRKDGWSASMLAEKYECDHTSILHQCRKHGVYPERMLKVNHERALVPIPKIPRKKLKKEKDKYAHLIFEPINAGRTYKSYMLIEYKKKIARHKELIKF